MISTIVLACQGQKYKIRKGSIAEGDVPAAIPGFVSEQVQNCRIICLYGVLCCKGTNFIIFYSLPVFKQAFFIYIKKDDKERGV